MKDRRVILAAGLRGRSQRRRRIPLHYFSIITPLSVQDCGGDNYIPGDQLLQIARHVVLGRIAQQQGDSAKAITEFQEAATLQDAMPYMEPPYWYYPVRQSLGAALLQADRAAEAADAFKVALKEAPNDGWAIYGLMEAQKKLGDDAGAKASAGELAKTWIGPRELLDLSKL